MTNEELHAILTGKLDSNRIEIKKDMEELSKNTKKDMEEMEGGLIKDISEVRQ